MNIFNKMFTTLMSPLFYLYKYWGKPNPYNDFLHMGINGVEESCNSSKTILITPIRVSSHSNLFEGLIGKFFELRGYNVVYFLCQGELDYCENIVDLKRKCLKCSLCKSEQSKFKKTFASNVVKISDFITREQIESIIKIVKQRTFEDSSDYIYDGINLKDAIEGGVLLYTKKSEINIYDDIDIVKKCALSSFVISQFLKKFVERNDVFRIISSHGIYSSWGAIVETANSLNIPTYIWGRGYIGKGNMLFGYNKAIQKDLRDEDKSVFKDIKLTEESKQVVKDYFLSKGNADSNVDYVNYYSDINKDEYDVKQFYDKICSYDKVYGMFTNIPWDGQIFNRTKEFPTTRVYLKSVVDWFKENPECLLVIRAHPAEAIREESRSEKFEELLKSEYPTLPPNVIFLKPTNPITSYEVAKKICCAIMYGSSMDLEFAIRNIPVVLVGQRDLKDKNIAFDVHTVSDLYNYLDSAKAGSLSMTKEMLDNAWKYGYYWVKIRNVYDSSVELSKLSFERYNFEDKKQFLEDPFLSLVFEKIVNNLKVENR